MYENLVYLTFPHAFIVVLFRPSNYSCSLFARKKPLETQWAMDAHPLAKHKRYTMGHEISWNTSPGLFMS